jgi:hypothetical protein
VTRPLRRYFFHVRLAADPLGPMQPLEVIAYDSHEAIRALPDDVVSWDWRQEGGVYSLPVDEKAAA